MWLALGNMWLALGNPWSNSRGDPSARPASR
jgi:hypothetical protein